MSVLWEWVGEGSIEKQVEVSFVLAAAGDDFGGGYTYEEFAPIERESFVARGMSRSVLNDLKSNARTKGSTYTATEKTGESTTGRMVGLTWSNISLNGTSVLEVHIELLIPPEEPEP